MRVAKYQSEYDAALLNPPLCACGCGELILLKPSYKYYGLAKYSIGHSSKGKPSWNKNKTWSEETKKKIGEAGKGRKAWNKGIASQRKGKTFKEIYGEVQGSEIASKISKSNKGQISDRKGKKYEEYYGIEKARELKEQKSQIFSGRTQPEYLKKIWSELAKGRVLSEETRQKISRTNKGKNKSRCGKTYEEIFGEVLATELKRKRSFAASSQKPKFRNTKPERILHEALSTFFPIQTHVPLFGCPDIFIEPNLCIFVDGDYWHANPIKYKSEIIVHSNKSAKQLWDKDKKVTDSLMNTGV